ncbi:hypothetical protein MIND_00482200 [Mycena indigotica]|uniref:NAD(P)-binding protein n=1 Tax=Mycena indigotica TaxID=2126181 RepID=A0A8H6SZ12_9AGAR|nr:uncharacterized protein MIND_00482200 [Mycena indigotica]KAF7306897.1 hypothetical protein MIND_00482200 [Mycena indigotica]
MLVDNQIVCITGASRGIGRGCALEFAKYGASGFILHYLGDADTEREILALKEEIEAFPHKPKVIIIPGDIADPATSTKIVDEGVKAFQRIDTLISNAGICPFAEFLTMPHSTWERTRAVNLDGSFYVVQAVANQMKSQTPQGGSIVGISSISALVGGGLQCHYTPTKAGILSLMQSCAVALGKYNIRANAVLPGTIATDINKEDLSDVSKRQYMEQRTCLGRLGEPSDIAGPAVFLASSLAKYVTGAALLSDGGLFSISTPHFLHNHSWRTVSCDSMSLKERIAAIHHREQTASPTPPIHGTTQIPSSSSAGTLKAKIAQFESQGAVPVPRGSFGLGAPPESKPQQRRELYGNRMQPARLPSAALGLARPAEAFATPDPRAIALPPDDTGLSSEPTSPLPRSESTRIPSSSSSSNGNAPNPFAFEELMKKARAPQTIPTTAAAKAVQEKHKQQTVTNRGTDFTKALEKARKAEAEGKERRRSVLLLQPQFTGGALTPQHTGGSSVGLTPQHTGGSLIIAPQTTGGSTRPFSPPPLSPLAVYSPPRSPMSPREHRLSFGASSPTTTTRPLSSFFSPDERPIIVMEPDERDENAEPVGEQPSISTPDFRIQPPLVPEFPSEPSNEVDPEPELVLSDSSETMPQSEELSLSDPQTELTEEDPQPPPENSTPPTESPKLQVENTDVPTSPTSGSDSFHVGHGTASPDSFHAGLDLDAHLRTHALTGESLPVSQSSFDDHEEEEEPVYSLGETEYLAPLPNNLASHRFRAHLSTITERSVEPGSPAWDTSRFSVGSSSWGDKRASRRESAGYGAVFEYIYEGRDMEEEHLEDEEDVVTPGVAGIGAGSNALAHTSLPSTTATAGHDFKVLHASRRDSDVRGRDDGPPSPSPYRLSYLTDRGYTPSLGSEDGDDEDQPQAELDIRTPTAYPTDFESRTPTVGLGPKTPGMDGVFGAASNESEESEKESIAPPRNSFLSTRDSLPPTQRDSLLSTNSRNSTASSVSSSAIHAQVLTLRPLSTMTIDSASPSHVTLAHRIPVVDGVKGVERAVYVPGNLSAEAEDVPPARPRPNPSSLPRPSTSYEVSPTSTPSRRTGNTAGATSRPHTTYLLDDEDDDDPKAEFGTISFGTQKPLTFSAVVHGRVREPARGPVQHGEIEKKLPLPPTPMSPGYASGDLAELLAEAAALEQRLERGELPAEALRRLSRLSARPPPKFSAPPPPLVTPLPVHQQQQNVAPLKPLRSIRNPLGRSRSDRRPRDDQDSRPIASASMGNLLSETPDQVVILRTSTSSDIPPTPPPKSPGARYFSSLRRLASTSRSLNVATTRGSVSTSTGSEFSSEDSMGLQTPPDDHQAALSPTPSTKGIVWPSLKSKKSAGSLGKSAASLAGKMWPRSRSKSSTSTTSSVDTAPSPPPVPVPPLPSPPALRLEPLPPSFAPPPHDADVITPVSHPPNTSLPVQRMPSGRPPNLILHTANGSTHDASSGFLPAPQTAPESKRSSWMSVSSAGSSSIATSPLFDQAIFDAFPSVPEMPAGPPPPPAPVSRQLPSPPRSNFSRSNSVQSSLSGSSVLPPLPTLSYSDASATSTPSHSEQSFKSGGGSYARDNLLARVAQTQRSVEPL